MGSPFIKLTLASVNHDEGPIPPTPPPPEETEKDEKMRMKRRIKNEPLSTKLKSGSCQEVVHTIQTTRIRLDPHGRHFMDDGSVPVPPNHLLAFSTTMIGSAILFKGSMTVTEARATECKASSDSTIKVSLRCGSLGKLRGSAALMEQINHQCAARRHCHA